MENYFVELNNINVSEKVESKNGLSYLSWAWAWGELKKRHPSATYHVYENANGCIYHTDGRTCWVKTGVVVNDIEHIEYLPVMDYKNRSISADAVTSFDVNKAIQRSLTKAVARHGLGLSLYTGEDLVDGEASQTVHNVTCKAIPEDSIRELLEFANKKGVTEAQLLKRYKIKTVAELTKEMYTNAVAGLSTMEDKNG